MEAPLAIQEFLEYVVWQLIDHPEEASVSHALEGDTHQFQLRLNPGDVGRVIGKGGNTISAIRSLASIAASRNGIRIAIEVDEAEAA